MVKPQSLGIKQNPTVIFNDSRPGPREVPLARVERIFKSPKHEYGIGAEPCGAAQKGADTQLHDLRSQSLFLCCRRQKVRWDAGGKRGAGVLMVLNPTGPKREAKPFRPSHATS